RHRVRGDTRIQVGVLHRRQIKPFAALVGQRSTHVTRCLAYHARQQIQRYPLVRENQITRVLACLVVNHDDRPHCMNGSHRTIDTRDVNRRDVRAHLVTRLAHGTSLFSPLSAVSRVTYGLVSFSTYLATTSTSMFTCSPTPRSPRVVNSSVVGINATANRSPSNAATVSDTPSIAIDP